jgi:hypothetical protein
VIAGRTRRTARLALLLAAAATMATGCAGAGDGSGSAGSKNTDKPVSIRKVTLPQADEDLTSKLGTDGETLTKAGCTFGTYEAQEPVHVDEGETLSDKEFPPTSGKHYDNWAPFGVYDEPIEDGFAVHDLEHGGVVVWLGEKVSDDVVDAIGELPKDEEKWVVAPRHDIDGLFSGAWGKGLYCPPAALDKLDTGDLADAVQAWFEAVNSTGSKAEKDVPAYAGAMKEPSPVRDVSAESPF